MIDESMKKDIENDIKKLCNKLTKHIITITTEVERLIKELAQEKE